MEGEDIRERNQIWRQVEEQGKRILGLEKDVTESKALGEKNEERLTRMEKDVQGVYADVHSMAEGMNQVVGGVKAIRFVAIVVGMIVGLAELLPAIRKLMEML